MSGVILIIYLITTLLFNILMSNLNWNLFIFTDVILYRYSSGAFKNFQ